MLKSKYNKEGSIHKVLWTQDRDDQREDFKKQENISIYA